MFEVMGFRAGRAGGRVPGDSSQEQGPLLRQGMVEVMGAWAGGLGCRVPILARAVLSNYGKVAFTVLRLWLWVV
jgi:hypothetical protein